MPCPLRTLLSMRLRVLRLAGVAAITAAFVAGCDDGSKYDRQYPAPQNEQNMMKVLRTNTTPSRPR